MTGVPVPLQSVRQVSPQRREVASEAVAGARAVCESIRAGVERKQPRSTRKLPLLVI
jgi:hypothetical protein